MSACFHKVRLGAIGALISLAIGCAYSPHGSELTDEEPTVEDLVGIYVKDTCFIPVGCGTEPAEITVELRDDGSFIAANVPPSTLGGPGPDFYSGFVSDTGHWTIDNWSTEEHPVWGVYLRDPGGDILGPEVTGGKGRFGLIFTIGDPDNGDAIRLKRK
jgi:hypothetical protein